MLGDRNQKGAVMRTELAEMTWGGALQLQGQTCLKWRVLNLMYLNVLYSILKSN